MYALYELQAFGNKLRTWQSVDELERSGYAGPLTIRYRGGAGGSPFTRYRVPAAQARAAVAEYRRRGAEGGRFNFNESAPDERLIFQGEVMRSTEHVTLRISSQKKPMRDAMAETAQVRHRYMLQAAMTLRSALFPSSHSDLCALFEVFPSAVIEVSVYAIPVGSLRGRNAIIWEVRDY